MELKTYFAQDAAGNIISSAIVKVFLQGTTTLATGLTRADGTPLENPFAADGAGRIQFRAPDGYYDVQVSAGPGIIQTLTIQCVDYSGAKADADRAEAAADRADASAEQVAYTLTSKNGASLVGSSRGLTVQQELNNNLLNDREQWRRSLAEAGLTLVDGSFDQGGTVATATDVLLFEAEGKAYSYAGILPHTVDKDSNPSAELGMWVDRSVDTLRVQLLNSAMVLRDSRFALRDFYSARDFAGVVGDKVADDTVALQAAIDSLPSGATFGFYGGGFSFDKLVLSKPITLVGDAELLHNGFRVKTSNVTSLLSGDQVCRNYASTSRAFQCYAYEDAQDYENIKILFNRFKGFFYSTDFRGREYAATPEDPTNRVLKNTLVMGCTSISPILGPGVTSGHYQHIGVTNARCIGNATYGGGASIPLAGATSYNFINGNGYLIVQGNYDENNSYGSMEIENNQLTHAVISGNVFGRQIWIDDSSNISITGNTVSDRILITAQSNDTDNITISGNTCSRISVTEFGEAPTGRHKSIHIVGNTTYGEDGSHDIFADSSVDRITIESNSLNGVNGNAVSISRSATCSHVVRNNRSRTARTFYIGGSGGRVIEYGNDNITVSGTTDSKYLSNMMIPSSAYLDLPGKYLHGTKYTRSINPGSTAGISLPIPDSGGQAFRGVSLWVLIREPSTNNTSSYRIDCIYKVVGAAVQLIVGTSYSSIGVDAASVTVANNASTSSSINILLTNTSGTKTLQVTVMPEVSSRLGVEE